MPLSRTGATKPDQIMELGGLAGMLGPSLLGGSILVLTVIEYEFLRSLGWHPISAVRTDWPSGLALGPQGWLMIGAFIGSGGLLCLLAAGLRRGLGGLGAGLLGIAGLALAGLAFKTDPTYGGAPRTLAGGIHDSAFATLAVSLLGSMLTLSWETRRRAGWGGYSRYCLASAGSALICFAISGVFYYLFLAISLAWVAATGAQLRGLAQRRSASD